MPGKKKKEAYEMNHPNMMKPYQMDDPNMMKPYQMGHSPKQMKHSPMPMKSPYNMKPEILKHMSGK